MEEIDREELLEELMEAKQALFSSRTLKELRFWQEKIRYIKERLKENA